MNEYRLLFSISEFMIGFLVAFTNANNHENRVYLLLIGSASRARKLKKFIWRKLIVIAKK